MSQAKSSKPPSVPARTQAQIEGDIVDTRERLVGTITDLEDRVNPTKVADRSKNKVVAFYKDDTGIRWKNVAITAGAVVGSLVTVRVVSKSVRWALAAPPPQVVPTDIVFLPVPRDQVGPLADLAAVV